MVSEWPKPLVSSRSERTGKREKLRRKSTRNSFSTAARSEDRVRGTLNTLEVLVRAERSKYVKSQLEKNYGNLQEQLREVERLSRLRDHHQPASAAESDDDDDILPEENGSLLVRSRLALFRENSRQSCGTGKNKWPQICSKLNGGNFDARKIVPIDTGKLEAVDRLPLCTAWMFVDRNERMAKDQSIARRRRIFYESNGKETFFCLETEEDEKEAVGNGEETKDIRTLSESEEFISRMAILEHGSGRGVLKTIADFLQVSVAKVESRLQTEGCASNIKGSWQPSTIHSVSQIFRRSICNSLQDHHSVGNLQQDDQQGVHKRVPVRTQAKAASSDEETKMSTTLALALDSFDTLFCRRCLVFNCALHPCFEEIVVDVNERQPPCVVAERGQRKPCSLGCRFFVSTFGERLEKHPAAAANLNACASGSEFQGSPSNISCATEAWQANNPGGRGGIPEDHLDGRMQTSAAHFRELDDDGNEEILLECELRTFSDEIPTLEVGVEEFLNSQEKTTRRPIIGGSVATKNAKKALDGFLDLEEAAPIGRTVEDAESSSDSMAYKYKRKHPKIPPPDNEIFTSSRSAERGIITTRKDKREVTSELWCSASGVDAVQRFDASPIKPAKEWNRLEQDLCEKGIQIFGKNSCLIAQNVLKGYKSCREIAEYIRKLDITAAANVEEGLSADGSSDRGTNPTNVEILPTGRVFRPKFRFGRKKVAPKSALGAIRKRIGREGGLLNHCRQYKPCSCESRLGCGKDCPCVLVDTHCEKYCGCFKVCKNRFRGCQCAKSMCDRRHCPCFAAGRECDPDLCKFCWIECGHSSSQECRNMRILQQKKKRVLLARSDVCTGWGVFSRHTLHKNDYIGEYAGELISHSEADRRGRIYDRETSFLFNLNDKVVLDAFRKGNKLKFANHSARKPNCYAKVLLVGGDHRVGIFAKDKIEAGEELLYDYQYEPEIAPLWATGAD